MYDNLGKVYLVLNDEKLSEHYYLKGAETWHNMDNLEKEAASYSYLAAAYNTFNRFEDAAVALEKSLCWKNAIKVRMKQLPMRTIITVQYVSD